MYDKVKQADHVLDDHDMACRLAGVPVTRRAAPLSTQRAAGNGVRERPTGDNVRERPSDDVRERAAGSDLQERAAAGNAQERAGDDAQERPTCDNGHERPGDDVQEDCIKKPDAQPDDLKKRVACIDPADSRDAEDSCIKRRKVGGDTDNTTQTDCASCFERFSAFDILQLYCKREDDDTPHAYCRDCLTGLFDASITNSSLFPPRCCSKIIPLFSCTPFLSKDLIARFVEEKEELDTQNRTYCSNPSCSKWTRPNFIIAEVAKCPGCSLETCTICQSKQHEGLCPEDSGVKQLMGFAEQKKWQTCPNCKNMVELDRGCYHIT